MNKDIRHIDLIEKYLDNNLDMDELKLFEETLENEEGFVRELNDMEVLVAGIKHSASKTTIEEKLDRIENSMYVMDDQEDDGQHISKTIFFDFEHIKKYSWAIAASLTLLLVTTIALFNIDQTPTHQKLYTEYYAPFENYGKKRGPENAEKNYWNLALAYYDAAQYDSALANFERVQISDYKGSINHPSFSLYKGNTLMKLERHDEAITIFKGMLADDDGMAIYAKWYLSMCYLYENKTEKLVTLLEEIAEVKVSAFSPKAQEILDQIN